MKVEGRLARADLGPGAWVLEAEDGRRFVLDGDVPEGLVGQRVRVEGEAAEAMGFAMTGDAVLVVSRVARA